MQMNARRRQGLARVNMNNDDDDDALSRFFCLSTMLLSKILQFSWYGHGRCTLSAVLAAVIQHMPRLDITQVALILLCRLLSWLQLASVVAPGSSDALHFVLILGQPGAGKASAFARLVDAPPEYAAQLGGGRVRHL